MNRLLRIFLAALLLGLFTLPTWAQDAEEVADEPVAEIEEVLVVTASRSEQKLHDVPASITVLTSKQIESTPADDYGDLLRNVPGLNVTQIGTRDINVSSREAVGSLSTGQLVLVDGRTLYLDFFGFVMWDLLPINTAEIKQIEVVQGPGSSVWGANAMKGVINVITKSPREMAGTYVQVGAGELETAYGSLLRAGAGEKWSYKASLSYYQQDEPYDRPTGLIPGTSTPYPNIANNGTSQPKVDFRFDRDTADDTTWSFSAGYAATEGLVHTGIGPFDVDSSSNMGYVKGSWTKRAMNVSAFINVLDGDSANLLTVGPDGLPLRLGFESTTSNIDFTNTGVIGTKNIFTYGINARHNDFELTIAPTGSDRDEFGIFLQDEILIGDRMRWVVGARYDDIDPIGNVVSPRTSLMFSPQPNSTFRISYNRAFRAPSLIENHLDIVIVNQVLLPAAPPLLPTPTPFVFASAAIGNPDLGEEQLDAYEIGYVGTFKKATFTFAAYRNETTDGTDFFESQFYSSLNPPPGWPLPPFIPVAPGVFIPTVPANTFPSVFSYRNIGESINQGVEVSADYRPTRAWRFNANYTYQEDPQVTGVDNPSFNLPPRHRFNFGISYDADHWYVNANMNYQDEAFWTDVLDSRFHGPTDSFTQVNVGLGFRFADDKYTLSITGSNIFDEEVQQHVFGDIISRKVTAELRFNF